MKIKPIKQRDASACGPTCIEMTLQYFDIPHTVTGIAKLTNYKKEGGIYNTQLVETVQSFGLKAKVHTNTTWEQLKKANAPNTIVIVSWMLEGYIGHLSVIEKVTETHVVLAEPTTGKHLKVEKIRFLRLWLDYEATSDVPMYPESKADIQLRWMVVMSKHH